MTPATIRILSALVGHEVRAGEFVTTEVDRIMAHDGTGPVVAATLAKHGIEHLRAADRAVFIFDHYYPPATPREAELQAQARRFAARHDIPVLAGVGIAHQVVVERALIRPGAVYAGGDSHTCTAGAVGSFAMGMGATDIAAVLASGRLWLEVPETIKVRLAGRLGAGVGGHDLALTVVGTVGVRGALGKAIEFVGPGIEALDMSDRLKLANHGVEMGAVATLIGVDDRCAEWVSARGGDLSLADRVPMDVVGPDADVEVDLGQVRPLVARPSLPDKVQPLDEVVPTEVHQVFVGSCAGGRIEDLRAAADILRGRQIAPNIRLIVGPASAEVLQAGLADGTIDALVNAGATLLPPGCGACMGRGGALADGEVAVATQNRNFVGRAGSPKSELYLASPTTAARVALTGRLDPSAAG